MTFAGEADLLHIRKGEVNSKVSNARIADVNPFVQIQVVSSFYGHFSASFISYEPILVRRRAVRYAPHFKVAPISRAKERI